MRNVVDIASILVALAFVVAAGVVPRVIKHRRARARQRRRDKAQAFLTANERGFALAPVTFVVDEDGHIRSEPRA